jgi:hypothetical protein
MVRAIFVLKKVPDRKEWPKIQSERGGVNYTNARRKKRFQNAVPACFLLRKNSGTAFWRFPSQKYP